MKIISPKKDNLWLLNMNSIINTSTESFKTDGTNGKWGQMHKESLQKHKHFACHAWIGCPFLALAQRVITGPIASK